VRRFPGLAGFPRADLGVGATPTEERTIAGLHVLVKREDLTSPVYGGNKARCLEFLLAGVRGPVLTYSTLGAHHAYATAVHARTLGLGCDAILVRRGPRGPLLDPLRHVARRVVEVGGVAGAALATLKLWRPGTRVLPPGGVSARGALGYVVAAMELESIPERIYVPLGSGTTVSGLLAGLMLRGAVTEVVAVRVADAVAGFRPLLWRRAFASLRLLRKRDPTVPRASRGGLRLRVVAAAGRYGEVTAEATAAMRAAPDLLLEPTYTAKTLAVLIAEHAEEALLINTYGGCGPSPSS